MKPARNTAALLFWLLVSAAALIAMTAARAGHDEVQVARWKSAYIPKHRQHEVAVIAERITKNRTRYEAVAARSGVPWYVIAGLHNMEASGAFTKHLHEGSPLTARTRWVPKGRPLTGKPPFTWEESAIDALTFDRMGSKQWTKLGPALTAVELYNGAGYMKYHPTTPTPYLWAGTSVERPGKYVADGKWSPTARSGQIGVSAIWLELESRKSIKVPTP